MEDLAESFLGAAGRLDLSVYHVYGTGLNEQLNEVFENHQAEFVKLMGHPTLQTEAEAGDQRLANKVIVRNSPTTFDDLKSILGVTITARSTDPLPIIRNEELLLLRGEANIGQGNLGPAETDINTVRAAAGPTPITLTAANAIEWRGIVGSICGALAG